MFEVEQLYRELGKNFRSFEPWHIYFITSCDYFERLYGRRADKTKKLYNGMLPCTFYQFFKPFDEKEHGIKKQFDKNRSFENRGGFDHKRSYESNKRDFGEKRSFDNNKRDFGDKRKFDNKFDSKRSLDKKDDFKKPYKSKGQGK